MKDIIDTSNMSAEKAATMDLVEAAREQSWNGESLSKELFLGKFAHASLFPFPVQSDEDRERGDEFINKLKNAINIGVLVFCLEKNAGTNTFMAIKKGSPNEKPIKLKLACCTSLHKKAPL